MFGLESEIIDEIKCRLVGGFLDVIVLRKLTRGRPLGGSDLITLINYDFDLMTSAETVYATLDSMERRGLIVSALEGRKKVFMLTERGKETIKVISNARKGIIDLMSNLL